MTESTRQKKIAKVLQNDLADLLQSMIRDSGQKGIILSVTKVVVTADLSLSKIHISIFPSEKSSAIINELNSSKPKIKHLISQRVKNQLRKMPDLVFYNDDTLDYIDGIERSVKGGNNPLDNPELLQKRKKI
jgi:ribosome-binding factor A